MKILVVVDMQNDFITESLANQDALKIVDNIAKYLSDFDGEIIFTKDTHQDNYLETYEGKNLPIKHCIEGTHGWEINDKLLAAIANKNNVTTFLKPTFGYASELTKHILKIAKGEHIEQIEFVGTCTDICVVSNVLGLKEHMPETDIIVHGNMCAGLTKESHEAALTVMKSCQVKVK